ncbi:MAG: acyl-CoA dehydrogenase family protein [Deltaproteobacteria bacterium]|nr:acyl-CoA dehydrogenase family protein [Deltaproteobacteria bacterium]
MFEFSEEHRMVQKMVRQWAEKELGPKVRAMEKGEVLPYELMRKLGRDFGIIEMARGQFSKPRTEGDGERKGGNPDQAALSSILAMELARVCPGFTLAFGASLGLCGKAIAAKGTPEQVQRFALPVLTMEKIGAWGMTEPGAGSDAFGSMKTTARPEGDGYLLNGSKTFITNAPFADTLLVYARLVRPDTDSRPVHAFILDRGMPGLETSKPMDKMGMHASPTGEIFLADVRVGRDRLLGGIEDKPSRDGAKDVFHGERTSMIPMCLGIVERCLDDCIAYAKTREQWGKTIGEFQLIQEKLARMFVARENIKNLLFKTIEVEAAGRRLSMAEASACKLYCARATTEVTLEAVQLMGGNGYMREYHVEMLMRDAKLLQIGGGTDEVQIVTIARALLGS